MYPIIDTIISIGTGLVMESIELKTWEEAKENCVSMGGKLFSKIDGTRQQVNFLFNKVGGNHWLGIYTVDHKTWIDTDGNSIDNCQLSCHQYRSRSCDQH